MTRLVWGLSNRYEAGVERGVIFTPTVGVAWNGLVSVNEYSAGGEASSVYYDGVKTLDILEGEDFVCDIQAFSYPDEFDDLVGLSWRVPSGTGYKLHLVWEATQSPTQRNWESLSDESSISLFQWTFQSAAQDLPGAKPSSHFVIDTTECVPAALTALENAIYGTVSTAPYLPTPQQVLDMFWTNALFRVVDNGDGTATITGPTGWVDALDATTYRITSPSAIPIDSETYRISNF